MAGPSLAIRSQVPNATVDNDGLMTKEQVVQLNNASGGGITLPLDEDLTFAPGDKAIEILANTGDGNGSSLTMNPSDASGEADANGGDVNITLTNGVGAGRNGKLNVGNGAITAENQPSFNAPHIYGNADGLYLSSDGSGPIRGGTGISLVQDPTPADSFVGLNVNDENIAYVNHAGIMPVSGAPSMTLGGDGSGPDKAWLAAFAQTINCGLGANLDVRAPSGQYITFSPDGVAYFQMASARLNPINNNQSLLGTSALRWLGVFANFFDVQEGAQLTAAATITPTVGQHHVVGATTIDNIATTNFAQTPGLGNPRFTLIADGGTITWSAAGNIATAGTVAIGLSQDFVWSTSSGKWHAVA